MNQKTQMAFIRDLMIRHPNEIENFVSQILASAPDHVRNVLRNAVELVLAFDEEGIEYIDHFQKVTEGKFNGRIGALGGALGLFDYSPEEQARFACES